MGSAPVTGRDLSAQLMEATVPPLDRSWRPLRQRQPSLSAGSLSLSFFLACTRPLYLVLILFVICFVWFFHPLGVCYAFFSNDELLLWSPFCLDSVSPGRAPAPQVLAAQISLESSGETQ